MKFSRLYILLALALLPAALFADDPKLVPALGWDVPTQGGFTTSVTLDAQNNVWVGTEGKGIWRYSPREKKWTQFTSKDGLGDDYVYALAVDKLGRVWAGHLNHGVSVWNGTKWQNYGIVDGPLGSRVFSITTCPTDGDVWMATDCGVARYSIANDDWDYFTRASGLPSNQIQCIAFDAKGNIYLGTQCDGIAMASAADNYKKWIIAPGLPQMPNAPTGAGLASSLINDIIVSVPPQNVLAPNETERLIAATHLGLSTSSDYGDHFNFIRGADWQDNVNGLLNVPAPPGQQGGPVVAGGGPIIIRGGGVLVINGLARNIAQQNNLLMEDWVTCVHQEKDTGRLWVGYRNKGLEIRNFGITPSIRFDTEGLDSLLVRSIWTAAKTPAFIAVYDEKNGGLKTPNDSTVNLVAGAPPPDSAPALPSVAKPPTTPDSILPLTKRLDFFKNVLKPGNAIFIGDDWQTGGDWVGHYGTSYAMLTPADRFENEAGFSATVELGPHHKQGEGQDLSHDEDRNTDDPHVLYYPTLGARHEGEANDLSYEDAYPPAWEGPDLWVTVEVPKGIHTLSLYFQNYDAQQGSDNKLRDYDIQILQAAETQEAALKETPLARARATDFMGGVYKQFAIAGPAKYVVHIKRNRSYVTKLLGLFIDRAVADPSAERKPIPGFENVHYDMPDAPDNIAGENSASLSAAADLWQKLVENQDKTGVIALEGPLGIWAYRAAMASKAPAALLANWRWQLCIWTQEDRDAFDKAMADAYKAYALKHPPENK